MRKIAVVKCASRAQGCASGAQDEILWALPNFRISNEQCRRRFLGGGSDVRTIVKKLDSRFAKAEEERRIGGVVGDVEHAILISRRGGNIRVGAAGSGRSPQRITITTDRIPIEADLVGRHARDVQRGCRTP